MGFFANLMSKARGMSRANKRLSKLPQKHLAPVEEIVEQGMLVDQVAIRMSVKNSIIMNALKRNVDYKVDEIKELVREKALELAAERGSDARHIARVRDEVRKYGRSAWQETEYGSQDSRTLKHRQEVYEQLAEELRGIAHDDSYVAETAEKAREAAWSEIGDSLKERATHPYYSGGSSPEYQEAREDRIQAFIEEDLTALIKAQTEDTESAGGLFKRKKK